MGLWLCMASNAGRCGTCSPRLLRWLRLARIDVSMAMTSRPDVHSRTCSHVQKRILGNSAGCGLLSSDPRSRRIGPGHLATPLFTAILLAALNFHLDYVPDIPPAASHPASILRRTPSLISQHTHCSISSVPLYCKHGTILKRTHSHRNSIPQLK
jgi:hypothetical protein